MTDKLFTTWLVETISGHVNVRLYKENGSGRKAHAAKFANLRIGHFVGHAVVAKAGGYENAAKTIENSLPTRKKMRSGDLGEVLATEYLNEETGYRVPIKKLRWKSDRETAMHGNDVIGIDTTGTAPSVAKVESKSRAKASAATVTEAAVGLDAHGGRPNPSTLAFITKRLLEEGMDVDAAVFEQLQTEGVLHEKNIVHVIFFLSGNDPSGFLSKASAPKVRAIKRMSAAVVVSDHQEFIREFFDDYGPKP